MVCRWESQEGEDILIYIYVYIYTMANLCFCMAENNNPVQCSCWRIPGTREPSGLPSMGSQSQT